jgi:hypothetical protein
MKRVLLASVLALVVGAAAASSAAAFGPADQAQPYTDGSIVMPPGVAQTFAVGRTGRLDGFTLTSPSGAPLFLQVYTVRSDGTPDLSHPLLARNAVIQLRPGITTDVSVSPISVRAGSKLALALGTIRSTAFADLAVGKNDRYPAGQLFQVNGAFSFKPLAGTDLTFSTHVSQ